MNGPEFLQLANLREKFSRPSEAEVAHYMNEVFPPLREAHLQAIEADIQGRSTNLLDNLKDRQRQFERHERKKISRLSLCAETITDLGKGYALRAIDALDRNNLADFRFNFDVSFGLSSPVSLLITAENHLSGTWEASAASIVPKVAETIDSIDSSIGAQVEQYQTHIRVANEAVDQLKKDRMGLAIIELWKDKILKSPGVLPRVYCRKYVEAGAELAGDLCVGLYQIASALYPSPA